MFVTITTARKEVGTLIETECSLEDLIEDCTTYEVGPKDGTALIPARFNRCPEGKACPCNRNPNCSACEGSGWVSGCVGTGTYDCGGDRDHRLSRNVYEMHALGIDLDDIPGETVDKITDALEARNVWFIVWTTHSNAPPDKCRIRLLFPFAAPMPLVNPRQWSAVAWPALIRHLGLPVGTDFSCRNPDRIYYLPRVPSEESPRAAGVHRGELLDWQPIVGAAIAAAASAVTEIEKAPDEDPSRPVDLEPLRTQLNKISDPILKKVMKGEAPTPPPDRRSAGDMPRREAWKRITVHVANVAEGWEDSNTLLDAFVRPAWRMEVSESPDDHTAWEKIQELFAGARASAPSYKAEKKARERGWFEVSRARLRRQAAEAIGGVDYSAVSETVRADAGAVEEAVTVPADAEVSPNEPAREYSLDDMGNAIRFSDLHRGHLRYVPAWGAWLAWDGRRWEREDVTITTRYAMATARSILMEAADCIDADKAKAIAKWAQATRFKRPLDAMVKLASGLEGIRVTHDLLDADPFAFNCSNGTIDLRTGNLRAHNVEDLITRLSPVKYDREAPCPTWERFLARVVPAEHTRTFIQRAIGYSLTGDVSEQVLFFLHGSGQNGKSTLLTVLQHVLGDYAKQGAPDLLLASAQHEAHPTAKADLVGARLVVCSEVEQGKSFAEVAIKQLTGGDVIKARFMARDFFEFSPTHKIFLAANHKPRVRGTDHAIWRRLRLIPFETTIPETEKDPGLKDKLKAEAPGILAWCVRGCMLWRAEGLGEAEAIASATAAYRADQDTLAHFIDENTEAKPDGYVTSSEIYSAFVRWCERNGEKPWSGRALSNALLERPGIGPGRSSTSRGFKGLVMKSMTRSAQVALAVVKTGGA